MNPIFYNIGSVLLKYKIVVTLKYCVISNMV